MRRDLAWFGVWTVLGAGVALGTISVIGIIVLPVTGLAVIFVATRRTSDGGLPGIVSGLGLPLLYVAYLNRDGPGEVCRTWATGSSCTEEWNPWPWFAVGAAFVLAGVAFFALRSREDRPAPPAPSSLRDRQWPGRALFPIAAVLLVSYGGAIVAAPVTLPAMFVVVRRHPSTGWRAAGALVGGCTAAEVAWAVVYLVAGEAQPLIWLLPVVAALAIAAGFARLGGTTTVRPLAS